MSAFITVLDQMLFFFLCIVIGYLLRYKKILFENADITISRLLSFVFMPAMIIGSFRSNCTPESLKANLSGVFFCLIMLLISVAIAFVLAPRFADKPEEIAIYRYSFIITNFGFMGYPLIRGLFGEEALFRFMIFALPASIFTYTFGVIWLTAGKRKFSWTMLFNPQFIAMIIGIVLGLFSVPLPSFVLKTLDGCSNCFSPLAMILTGFVIARFDLGSLLSKKQIYLLTILRLVAFPLLFYGLCLVFRIPEEIRRMILFFSCMPLGLNTIIFPAAYGGDETHGAAMAVISNLIGLVTVPLLLTLVM